MELTALSLAAAAAQIAAGETTSEALVAACLARIETLEGKIQAWAHLDLDHARAQALAADEARRVGQPLGPLHGVPIGVKDIFDTADLPTENGSVLHAGRQPEEDSAAVTKLRAAGAVILGKTVTTEFAMYGPGKTGNPQNPKHTPGGSSSGSAAAVACGMVPGALGSQTNGSVIRPAAFCGVAGYKPTHGLISRHGVLALSRPLDTLGVFARDVADLALLAEAVMGYDARDPDMRPRAAPRLCEVAAEASPVTPNLVFVRGPAWERASDDGREAFEELARFLGERMDSFDLPAPFDQAIERHGQIMKADLARNLAREYATGKDKLSDKLRAMIEEGQAVTAVEYNRALDFAGVLNAGLEELFSRYDAIVTPAAPGEAPEGLGFTGDPAFCTLWTYLGTPAVSLPLLQGAKGLPIGVQLVGPRGDDARLLRTARWLMGQVETDQD